MTVSLELQLHYQLTWHCSPQPSPHLSLLQLNAKPPSTNTIYLTFRVLLTQGHRGLQRSWRTHLLDPNKTSCWHGIIQVVQKANSHTTQTSSSGLFRPSTWCVQRFPLKQLMKCLFSCQTTKFTSGTDAASCPSQSWLVTPALSTVWAGTLSCLDCWPAPQTMGPSESGGQPPSWKSRMRKGSVVWPWKLVCLVLSSCAGHLCVK